MFRPASLVFAIVAVFGQEVFPAITQTTQDVNQMPFFENNVGENTGRFENMMHPLSNFMGEDNFDTVDVAQFEHDEDFDEIHDSFDTDDSGGDINGVSSDPFGPNFGVDFGQGPMKGGFGQAPLKDYFGQF